MQRILHKTCSGLTPSEMKCMPLQKRMLRLLCRKCKEVVDTLPKLISVIEEMKNEIKSLKEIVLDSNKEKNNKPPTLLKSYASVTAADAHETLTYTKKVANNFPSVIIKPKKNQDSTVTKNDIFKNISPEELNIGVNNIKLAKSGNITIKCSTKEDVDKLKNMAISKLKNYEVEETKLRKPRIKIIGYTKDKNEEEIEQSIKKQNR